MDPDALILVWRRRFDGDEMLQIADGKSWRLPHRSEVGLRHAVVDGAIAALVHAPFDFDPGRLHRWVPVDRTDPAIDTAWRQAGAAVVVWRRTAAGADVLLLHQSVRGPDDEGDWAWSPPGGSLDPGETLEQCAARELFEETGLDLPLVRLVAPGLPVAVFTCEAGAAHVVTLSEEHDRLEWVPVEEALARCRPVKIVEVLRAAAESIT